MPKSSKGASLSVAALKNIIVEGAIVEWADDDGNAVAEVYTDDLARKLFAAIKGLPRKGKGK